MLIFSAGKKKLNKLFKATKVKMKFIIVDDHALISQALSFLIMEKDPANIVLTASSRDEAAKLLEEEGDTTDLLILDLNLPGVSGTEFMEDIVQRHPMLKILVLSGTTNQVNIMKVLSLGAAGFVPKSLDSDMLTNAIDFVLKGGVFIPTKLLATSQANGIFNEEKREMPHITERQKDVLKLLAEGAPIKKICRQLNLSEGTVKTHVAAIYRAFGARNRTEALLAARRCGFDILV